MSAGERADPRNVFVVHGRNVELRRAMFEFLRSIDLNPIEWSMAVAMTESGAPYVGEVLDAAFAKVKAVVVLLTPDEIAYLQPTYGSRADDPETQPAPQARPNVLLEAGMALGRHPRHTVLVEIGELRPFSDVTGRHAIRMTNDVARRQELAQRLQTAGCEVSLIGTDWHTAGDFSAPSPPGHGLPLGRRMPSTRVAKRIDFAARYHPSGSSSRGGRLQVTNRGTEAAHDVKVTFPERAALSFLTGEPSIRKIPGGGKSVNLTVWHGGLSMGGPSYDDSFDITISAHTADGEPYEQEVFIDANEV
jgi:predicted nucleotide-binding protein